MSVSKTRTVRILTVWTFGRRDDAMPKSEEFRDWLRLEGNNVPQPEKQQTTERESNKPNTMTVGAIFANTYRRGALNQSRMALRPRGPKPAGANKDTTKRTASNAATPPAAKEASSFVKEYGCDNVSDLAWMLVP